MFNLIVKSRSWGNGRDMLPDGRAFEYTEPSLDERFKPGGQLDFAALMALPTLFVEETSRQTRQVAHVGTITRARITGAGINRQIMLEYTYDLSIPAVPNQNLQRFAADFDITQDFELSRTHWSVKDVDLYRVLLRNSLHRQQPKVFQLAEYENIEPGLASAMMPFHPSFNDVYATLQGAAKTVGLRCRRADDIWENPAVIQDVVSLIDRSSIVICDCTGRNPNVFYEIGIAHALGREVILITQIATDIPFDLSHLRYVSYLNNGEGLKALGTHLQSRLNEIVQRIP